VEQFFPILALCLHLKSSLQAAIKSLNQTQDRCSE